MNCGLNNNLLEEKLLLLLLYKKPQMKGHSAKPVRQILSKRQELGGGISLLIQELRMQKSN